MCFFVVVSGFVVCIKAFANFRFQETHLKDLLNEGPNPRNVRKENTKRILIEGNPGIGKSVLSSKLLHDWATDRKSIQTWMSMT